MDKERIARLLELAREIGPEIEAALSGVKDIQMRNAIAGAIMQRILQELPIHRAAEVAGGAGRSNDLPENLRTTGTQKRIVDLRADGFFGEPRRLEQVLEELEIRGYHHNKSDVRMSLLRLARKNVLRRITFGRGSQKTFLYASP